MISAIFVSYRSAGLAREAIAGLRREAREADLALEVIAVVNSGDPVEKEELRAAADRMLDPGRNLGYAGGLNLGLSVARGETFLLANPDLVFRPGSLASLVGALKGTDLLAAGPAFFLDEGESLLVPPFEEPHPFDIVRRRFALDAAENGAIFRRDIRRVVRTARAVERGETLEASALSGALLAMTRRALEAAGPFDEAYPLYYEENDWQRRLRRCGGRLLYVGAARVVHLYNQSAGKEPKAAEWFAESERRYFQSHFGARGVRALAALAAAPPWPRPLPAALPGGALPLPDGVSTGVAVSPLPYFRPFAFARPAPGARTWRAPADFAGRIQGTPWYARAFELPTGRVLGEGACPV